MSALCCRRSEIVIFVG